MQYTISRVLGLTFAAVGFVLVVAHVVHKYVTDLGPEFLDRSSLPLAFLLGAALMLASARRHRKAQETTEENEPGTP